MCTEIYLMWRFYNLTLYGILSVPMHGTEEKYIQTFNHKLRGILVVEIYLMWSFYNLTLYIILLVPMHGRKEKFIQKF